MNDYSPTLEDLKGLVMASVVNEDNARLIFTTVDGQTFMLYHRQACCESVKIEDICGDLNDLVGEPLLLVEEVVSEKKHHKFGWDKSCTWTFYKFATRKGSVTVRWYGSSNGYYSERVHFC